MHRGTGAPRQRWRAPSGRVVIQHPRAIPTSDHISAIVNHASAGPAPTRLTRKRIEWAAIRFPGSFCLSRGYFLDWSKTRRPGHGSVPRRSSYKRSREQRRDNAEYRCARIPVRSVRSKQQRRRTPQRSITPSYVDPPPHNRARTRDGIPADLRGRHPEGAIGG